MIDARDFKWKPGEIAKFVNDADTSRQDGFTGGKINRYRERHIIPSFLYKSVSKGSGRGYSYAREAAEWALFGANLNSAGEIEERIGRLFQTAIQTWGASQDTLHRMVALFAESANYYPAFLSRLSASGVTLPDDFKDTSG